MCCHGRTSRKKNPTGKTNICQESHSRHYVKCSPILLHVGPHKPVSMATLNFPQMTKLLAILMGFI